MLLHNSSFQFYQGKAPKAATAWYKMECTEQHMTRPDSHGFAVTELKDMLAVNKRQLLIPTSHGRQNYSS